MGWFDDDDDDDDDEVARPAPKSDSHKNDDAEDPLEAYMKSLQEQSTAAPSAQRAERLDVDQDDDDDGLRESVEKPCCDEEENQSQESNEATNPMSLTFQKASASQNRNHDSENLTLDRVRHGEVSYADVRRELLSSTNTPKGHEWRKENQITCHPPMDPVLSFHELKEVFNDAIMKIISQLFEKPTLVQSQVLSAALAGNDVFVTAATGSGKTLSYVWPMVVHACDQPLINPGVDGPIGLVLCPTRELSAQVHKQCIQMLQPYDGHAVNVTGGNKGRYEMTKELQRGCECIVSTPGRLLDMIKAKATNLTRVTMLVLDEADKMLDMGFEAQVTSILQNIRPKRQTLMLSATFGTKVQRIANRWLDNPVRIAVGRTGSSSEHVTQHVMILPTFQAKEQWLMEMMPLLHEVGRILVFVATRADCDSLAQRMLDNPTIGGSGLLVSTLHGDKDQRDRNTALAAFKKGQLAALIATDVASRGLDVPDVMTVVNFDVAKNLDSHVHRVGRAGRMSSGVHQKGSAYTLLTPKNVEFAAVLANAFEREGRPVSDELKNLAQKSRRYGNCASRTKWNQSGLGFQQDHNDFQSRGASGGNQRHQQRRDFNNHFSGPSETSTSHGAPPQKRSRWG